MAESTTLESLLKRDRAVVLGGLVGVCLLSWAYMVYLAWKMGAMETSMGMAMPRMQSWGAVDLVLLFVMWAVMMVAMMVPSAAPMILMFAMVNRGRRRQQRPFVPTAIFLSGYLLAWTGFSLVATVAQWGLHSAALLSPMMVSTSPLLGGGLLVVAGLFQWLPLKEACLRHCRSPLSFLTNHWREGAGGALVMGLHHGAYCAGCCWALMALLFVGGVMNLLWVAAIAAFVLIEKVAPAARWITRLAGLACIASGVWIAVSGGAV